VGCWWRLASLSSLDLVFRGSAEEALADKLDTQVFALIGAVEPDEVGNLTIPQRLLEPRLGNPGSGLYAEILDASGLPLWRSSSAVGLDLATGATLNAGQRTLTRLALADGTRALMLGWRSTELGPTATPAFQVFVAADLPRPSASWGVSQRCSVGFLASCSSCWSPSGLRSVSTAAIAPDVWRIAQIEKGGREAPMRVPAGTGGCRARLQHAAAVRAAAHGTLPHNQRTTLPQPEDAVGCRTEVEAGHADRATLQGPGQSHAGRH
jgi:hypothetical protein